MADLVLFDDVYAIGQLGRKSIRMRHRIAGELGLTVTVIFTEHDMAVVFEVASQLTVLHLARILAKGSPQAGQDNPDVQRVDLGESAVSDEDTDR